MAKLPTLQPMPRLPKEPAPEMLRSFGPRPAPQPQPAAAAPIESPSPSAYREKNPYSAPPKEYKAPSLLREHRRLALLFAGVAAALAMYCLKLRHPASPAAPPSSVAQRPAVSAPAAQPASAAQPIYIESVPDKNAH